MKETFAELFKQSLARAEMQPGSIITGKVLKIDDEYITINAGLKSEGRIPIEQFYNENNELDISVGDEVEVVLEAMEDGWGETRLSRDKAKRAEAWRWLAKAHEAGELVKGIISGKVKGGFTVDIQHIRAFLPGSLVDLRPVRDTGNLEGKEFDFKVIKLDQKRNNVVVSRRSAIEAEAGGDRDALEDFPTGRPRN